MALLLLFLYFQLEDFISSPDVGEHSRFFVKTFLENSKIGILMNQNKMVHQLTKKEFISYIPCAVNTNTDI